MGVILVSFIEASLSDTLLCSERMNYVCPLYFFRPSDVAALRPLLCTCSRRSEKRVMVEKTPANLTFFLILGIWECMG